MHKLEDLHGQLPNQGEPEVGSLRNLNRMIQSKLRVATWPEDVFALSHTKDATPERQAFSMLIMLIENNAKLSSAVMLFKSVSIIDATLNMAAIRTVAPCDVMDCGRQLDAVP